MDITLDFDVYRWKLGERILFEKVAGMTAERALSLFAKVEEDEDSALDIPAKVQAAFVWIVARRSEPGMTFEQATDLFDGMSFIDAVPEADEDAAAPLAEKVPKRSSPKSSARSATTSTTPRTKSAT